MADKRVESQRGFTLAELLVVVAIIAVLVAISMPVFSGQLERSREATDLSNVRSAYAEVMTAALIEDKNAEYNGASMLQADGSYQASVQLVQETDGWQTDDKDLSIGGVSSADVTHWLGLPEAKGTCVVRSVDGQVYFYWDDYNGGGGSGGDDPNTPSPSPNPGTGSLVIKNPDGSIAVSITTTSYPEKPGSGESCVVTKGSVYQYNGSFYAVTDTVHFNKYYYRNPGSAEAAYLFVKIPGDLTLTPSDPFPNGSLKAGMVFKINGDYYLRINGSEHGTPPTGDGDGTWLRLNTI